jgi:hypothetical protein
MDCLFLVINQGKANKMGRIEYLAAAPQVDPMMSSSFWHGLLWLYLLLVENFQFPDFENWDKIFDIPTYPSARNHKQISRNDYSKLWSAFFEDAHVHVNKLTHIWRGQGERELDEQLVPMSNIARMTGHASASNNDSKQQMGATTSQVMSYITSPPMDAVVGRAGGDPRVPRSHCPARSTVEVSDILLSSIPQVEKLIINLAEVTSKRRQCTSYKEVKAGRLVTACGTLNGILNNIKDTILGLASHPVDPDNLLILQDMPTIGEQHSMNSNSTIRDILVQPFFKVICMRIFADVLNWRRMRHLAWLHIMLMRTNSGLKQGQHYHS